MWELAIVIWTGGKMVYYDHMWRGSALRIAAGILPIFLVFAGGAGALSNSGGGSRAYSRDISISNPGGALSDC